MTRTPATFLELSDLLAYVGQVIERGIPGAVWVRAELASVTDRRHLYLDLVQSASLEQGGDGREVAKARATLWARERFALEGKFRRATGGGLAAGMNVLLMVTAEFHPQYGFSLHILDIAPEFTVGDMALKLDGIRRTLAEERLLARNRSLPEPSDYTRVAVISPANAAGLGDFRREADALEAAGLVQFVYLPATFQGREASSSLLNALGAALLAHAEAPLDALVLIRGGGATTDLAWLNDLELARAVARFPVPVISGIGHARDDTILDEVACLRMDTPSKAAALIVGTVAVGAQQAERDFRQIVAADAARRSRRRPDDRRTRRRRRHHRRSAARRRRSRRGRRRRRSGHRRRRRRRSGRHRPRTGRNRAHACRSHHGRGHARVCQSSSSKSLSLFVRHRASRRPSRTIRVPRQVAPATVVHQIGRDGERFIALRRRRNTPVIVKVYTISRHKARCSAHSQCTGGVPVIDAILDYGTDHSAIFAAGLVMGVVAISAAVVWAYGRYHERAMRRRATDMIG